MVSEIRRWLATPRASWAEGVLLLEKVSPRNPQLSVIRIADTTYARNLLRQELEKALKPVKESAAVQEILQPAPVRTKAPAYNPDLYFTLPDSLQALEREKSKCMREIIAQRSRIKKMLRLQKPERISLTDALRAMNSYDSHGNPIPFSIGYVTANAEDKTGGEWRYIKSAFLSITNATGTRNFTGKRAEKEAVKPRRANHWINSTRNIFPVGGNRLKCIHIWLIMEFNGKEVVIGQTG